MDAIGGGTGTVKITRVHGVEAHTVLDINHTNYDIGCLVARLEKEKSLDLFISPEDALVQATDQFLLITVDHSKYSITYDAKLYDKLENHLVIIGHHRRGEEFPKNPVLIYIESCTSPTYELVTEMIEYQPQRGERLLADLEAAAMLAGITVDPREFSFRISIRTFDATSYLRSIGVGSAVVLDLLREDTESLTQKTKLVASLKIYKDDIILLLEPDDEIIDPIAATQTVDMALSLERVDASSTVTRCKKDTIDISARSMGDTNVQVIMEKLGSGGHLSNAVTQLRDITVDEAKEELEKAIGNYLEENEQLF